MKAIGKIITTQAKSVDRKRKSTANASVPKLDTIVESASKKKLKLAATGAPIQEAVSMLTVFGLNKNQSNEIFAVK